MFLVCPVSSTTNPKHPSQYQKNTEFQQTHLKATHSAGFAIFRKYFVVHVKRDKLAM